MRHLRCRSAAGPAETTQPIDSTPSPAAERQLEWPSSSRGRYDTLSKRADTLTLLGDDVADDFPAFWSCQPHIEPLILDGQLRRVDAQQIEHRRVEVVHADRILDGG